jgi:iduronate 2-sulfatase
MKHAFFFWMAIQLASLPVLHAADTEQQSFRPNVLFIAADDLRNDLGCYGHELVKSPNLDRLARRAVVFDRAYCQQAVCNPSRASLLTGRRPDTLRIWDLPTHFREHLPDVVTLPQYFKQHGYFTQNIGKIFHNFRQSIQGDPDSWSVPAVMHYANHNDDKPIVDGPLRPNLAHDPKCQQRDVPDEAYFDGRVAQLAIEALRERQQSGQPFFLAVGFWKPHSPFNAPKRYWDLYSRDSISLPKHPEWPLDAPRIGWHDSREILGQPARTLSAEAVREMRHGYLANISYFDAQLGRILDELDRLQLADKTVIVFWADHGYHLGEQSLWAKTSNFELDARVPLLIAPPGSVEGKRSSAIVELLDLYPTLAELCGLPAPPGVEGVSLLPVLKNPNASVKKAALTQHPRPAYYNRESSKSPEAMGYSVRTDRFRYTEWRDWKSGVTVARELYDHLSDPDETKNFAGEAAYSEDMKECARILESFHPLARPH